MEVVGMIDLSMKTIEVLFGKQISALPLFKKNGKIKLQRRCLI